MAEALRQFVLALVFLTRAPLTGLLPRDRIMPLARAVWAFPLIGAGVGALAAAPLALGAPPLLAAALGVALAVWSTGGLHEDGLADFADGMGGRDREARLAIMRDSRIGAYGAMTLILALMLRVAAMVALPAAAVILSGAVGRTALVAVMAALPPARADGLSQGAGRPPRGAVIGAGAMLVVITALTAPGAVPTLAALTAATLATALIAAKARSRLGGQTGDVLGAVAASAEIAALVGFALTR